MEDENTKGERLQKKYSRHMSTSTAIAMVLVAFATFYKILTPQNPASLSARGTGLFIDCLSRGGVVNSRNDWYRSTVEDRRKRSPRFTILCTYIENNTSWPAVLRKTVGSCASSVVSGWAAYLRT